MPSKRTPCSRRYRKDDCKKSASGKRSACRWNSKNTPRCSSRRSTKKAKRRTRTKSFKRCSSRRSAASCRKRKGCGWSSSRTPKCRPSKKKSEKKATKKKSTPSDDVFDNKPISIRLEGGDTLQVKITKEAITDGLLGVEMNDINQKNGNTRQQAVIFVRYDLKLLKKHVKNVTKSQEDALKKKYKKGDHIGLKQFLSQKKYDQVVALQKARPSSSTRKASSSSTRKASSKDDSPHLPAQTKLEAATATAASDDEDETRTTTTTTTTSIRLSVSGQHSFFCAFVSQAENSSRKVKSFESYVGACRPTALLRDELP